MQLGMVEKLEPKIETKRKIFCYRFGLVFKSDPIQSPRRDGLRVRSMQNSPAKTAPNSDVS